MSERKIVILTAVQIEFTAVERALKSLNRPAIEIHLIGIGGVRLGSIANLASAPIVIMAGLGGALEPALKVGDVVLDDPANLVPATVALRRGKIFTADQIVSTPAQKQELFEQTGSLAVDMEAARVRELVPAAINVRAISDSADEALDPRVVGLVDETGRAKPIAIASSLLRQPSLLPYLNRLGRHSKLAAEQLGHAVRYIVEAIDRDNRA